MDAGGQRFRVVVDAIERQRDVDAANASIGDVVVTRYITRAGVSDYWLHGSATADVVFESERSPVESGILNAEGQMLYRVPETVPLGFHAKPRVRVKAGRR